jgi:hypothetical protein
MQLPLHCQCPTAACCGSCLQPTHTMR